MSGFVWARRAISRATRSAIDWSLLGDGTQLDDTQALATAVIVALRYTDTRWPMRATRCPDPDSTGSRRLVGRPLGGRHHLERVADRFAAPGSCGRSAIESVASRQGSTVARVLAFTLQHDDPASLWIAGYRVTLRCRRGARRQAAASIPRSPFIAGRRRPSSCCTRSSGIRAAIRNPNGAQLKCPGPLQHAQHRSRPGAATRSTRRCLDRTRPVALEPACCARPVSTARARCAISTCNISIGCPCSCAEQPDTAEDRDGSMDPARPDMAWSMPSGTVVVAGRCRRWPGGTGDLHRGRRGAIVPQFGAVDDGRRSVRDYGAVIVIDANAPTPGPVQCCQPPGKHWQSG